MMILFTDEQTRLYDELEKTTDPERIKEIRKRLLEIAKEREDEYKDCPFVH